jgi:hypothetical protein
MPSLLRSAGPNPEMGPALHRTFLEAGLRTPSLQMEVPLGSDPDFTRRMSDLFETLRPRIHAGDPALANLGDLDTLPERLQAEVAASRTAVPWIGLVGAWSRTPSGGN